jgi:branched-subunit amino acid ABC-type transport system permease component
VDLVLAMGLQALVAVATLVLIGLGLAVIFGMMRIVNLAHGEFLMLGGYAAILAHQAGLDVWLAMLVVAPLAVGAVGLVVERLIIRPLHGRMVDTMLATWGLSLLLIGAVTTIFGNTISGFSAPLGSVAIGAFRVSGYELFLILAAAVLLAATYAILRFTTLGLIARGTMQNAGMAAALGVDPARVHALTFAIGAALSGLAGALIAPLSGVVPTMGAAYIAKAFITVITGGAAILAGLLSAATLLGSVATLVTFLATPVLGEVALLVMAVILLRLLPRGITGRFFRRSL